MSDSLEGIEPKYLLLSKPLTAKDADIDGWITCVVPVPFSRILQLDYEGFIDLLSDLAVGNQLLMDVGYDVVGFNQDEQELHIEVRGDTALAFEGDRGEEDNEPIEDDDDE